MSMKTGDARRKATFRVALWGVVVVVAVFRVLGGDVIAAEGNMVDNVIFRMQESAAAWGESLKGVSVRLFGFLAVISFAWNVGALLYGGHEPGVFFERAYKYIIVTGSYLFLVTKGPVLMGAIIATFFQMGGKGDNVLPGEIMGKAFTAFGVLVSKVVFPTTTESIWDIIVNVGQIGPLIAKAVTPLITLQVGFFMILSAGVIAACLALQIVKAYVLAYCGYFYFAFGGCEWTRPMALNYFRSVLVAGVELLATLLAFTFFSGLYADLIASFVNTAAFADGVVRLQDLITILFAMLLCACFITLLPPAVARVVKGVTTSMRLPVSRRNVMTVANVASKGTLKGVRMLVNGGGGAARIAKRLASKK